jgi:hypothetical protein
MRTTILLLLLTLSATTAQARKPDRTPPPPTSATAVVTDATGQIVGAHLFLGDNQIFTSHALLQPEGVAKAHKLDFIANPNRMTGYRVYYDGGSCGGQPYLRDTIAMYTRAGERNGVVYVTEPGAVVESVYLSSYWHSGNARCENNTTQGSAVRAMALPQVFTAPFKVEVR